MKNTYSLNVDGKLEGELEKELFKLAKLESLTLVVEFDSLDYRNSENSSSSYGCNNVIDSCDVSTVKADIVKDGTELVGGGKTCTTPSRYFVEFMKKLMQQNRRLQSLTIEAMNRFDFNCLSACTFNNMVSTSLIGSNAKHSCVIDFASACPQLEKIKFCNIQLSPESLNSIARLFSTLKSLKLCDCDRVCEVINVPTNCIKLQSLRFTYKSFTDNEIKKIFTDLTSHTKPMELSIKFCAFGDNKQFLISNFQLTKFVLYKWCSVFIKSLFHYISEFDMFVIGGLSTTDHAEL